MPETPDTQEVRSHWYGGGMDYALAATVCWVIFGLAAIAVGAALWKKHRDKQR